MLLTCKLIVHSHHFPLQSICLAERVNEELSKSVKSTIQCIRLDIKMVVGVFLQRCASLRTIQGLLI